MNKRILTLLSLLFSLGLMAQTEEVIFSASGGFYPHGFPLSLSCYYPDHHVRFTTNGNTPTATSTRFTTPLFLNEELFSNAAIHTIPVAPENLMYYPDTIQRCIVIRAAVFDDNYQCISDITTNTYLIQDLGNEHHGLAAISICADSLALFDQDTGIFVPGTHWDPNNPQLTGNYYQKGMEWERIANIEFYEPDNNDGINQICGLRTHGNRARRYPSKGMKVYAREEYGKKHFKHHFFSASSLKSFKRLVIKPFSTLWPESGTQDHITNQLALRLGLEAPHSRPVVVYLNGEYWGIYFLQEKMDERYLEDHFDLDPDSCDIIGNWQGTVESGDNESFIEMMDWVEDADLALDQNFQYLCGLIDVDNFIDYQILETFIANYDWPANNMRCWRTDNQPWRWIFYDGDATLTHEQLDVFANATYTGLDTWPSNIAATLLFRRLLENNLFRDMFTQRAHYLCDSLLQYEQTAPYLNDITEKLQPEIERHTYRFGYPDSLFAWSNGNILIDGFLKRRTENYLNAIDHLPYLKPSDHPSNTTDFICYPNPTDNAAYIQMLDEKSRPFDITISDVLGRIYLQENHYFGPSERLEFGSKLRPGLYIIKVGEKHQRFLKQ